MVKVVVVILTGTLANFPPAPVTTIMVKPACCAVTDTVPPAIVMVTAVGSPPTTLNKNAELPI